jgi:hypothetical protein
MPNQPWTQGIILVNINSRQMDDKNQFGCLDLSFFFGGVHVCIQTLTY